MYVELHAHSAYSFLDGASLPEELVAAQPLLGGSFLRNFIYKLDPDAGELRPGASVRVEGDRVIISDTTALDSYNRIRIN